MCVYLYVCVCMQLTQLVEFYLYSNKLVCLPVCVRVYAADAARGVLPVQQQARLSTCRDWLPDELGDTWFE